MTTGWILVCLLALPSAGAAAADRKARLAEAEAGIREASGLCAARQLPPLMACKTRDARLVAVCNGTQGLVQLAMARAGSQTPQLTLPGDPADKSTVTVGAISYARGGASYIRFKTEGRDYVVYSGMGNGWEQAGLMATRGEEILENHVCLPAEGRYDAGFQLLEEEAGYVLEDAGAMDLPIEE